MYKPEKLDNRDDFTLDNLRQASLGNAGRAGVMSREAMLRLKGLLYCSLRGTQFFNGLLTTCVVLYGICLQAAILVLGCPRERFTTGEFEILKRYVKQGGSVLVMLAEGGETKAGTNINYWLEEYGIAVNSDAGVFILCQFILCLYPCLGFICLSRANTWEHQHQQL